jgi:hypothetical protein
MRALVLMVLALAACFNPDLGDEPFLCGDGNACPPGYHCDRRSVCVRADLLPDGASAPDAHLADAPPNGSDARRFDARPFPDAGPTVGPDAAGAPDSGPCAPGTVVGCFDDYTANLCGGGTRDCGFRCDPQRNLCEDCDPSAPTFCSSPDTVATCSSDGQVGPGLSTCAGFCDTANGQAACLTLEPSNLSTSVCQTAGAKTRHVTAMLTIDTDSCIDGTKVAQPGGPTICLEVYSDLTIDNGAGFTAQGTNALAIVATHDLLLSGTIDVSAMGPTGGAGVPNPPPGLGKTVTSAYFDGGGGGGFAQPGGGGGTDSDDGAIAGGPGYGADTLIPLLGGSPGGAAGSPPSVCDLNCPSIAKGGGGGGAVQLVGCHILHVGIVGRVLAGGGGGQGGFYVAPPLMAAVFTPASAGGGGGGGAGGAILLEAGQLDFAEFAVADATGGGGGGGGTFGQVISSKGGDGGDAEVDRGALGGSPGSSFAGRGGDGANGPGSPSPTPGPGLAAQAPGYGAGGGGGSQGRIRVNTPASRPFDASNSIIVPAPATGAVHFHR